MKRQIEQWLLGNVQRFPADLASKAEDRFQVSRSYVNRILRNLTESGRLTASGVSKGRLYALPITLATWDFPLRPDLQEHVVWRELVRQELDGIGRRAMDLCNYGFGEMFNNAVEHSEGGRIHVSVSQSSNEVGITILDDGVGIFHKIQDAFDLSSQAEAAFELSKGKLTTDPEGHSGEGIFFTSRMFDRFSIVSGNLVFRHTPNMGDWLLEAVKDHTPGTLIQMKISPHTTRRMTSIYDEFSASEDNLAFDITHVPVSLLQFGEEMLVSRSQAKRVLARIPLFRRVVLNFSGVKEIGQAFADEMFRVFANEHPDVQLVILNVSPQVKKMIARAGASGLVEALDPTD